MKRFGGADPSAPGPDPFEPGADPGQSADNQGLELEGQPDPNQPGQPGDRRDPNTTDPEESFSGIDPKTLPSELLPVYKSMQRDFTQKNQEFGAMKKVVTAFNADPVGTLDALARQRGYRMVPLGADPASPKPGGDNPPATPGGKDPLEGLDEDEQYVAGVLKKVLGTTLGEIQQALQQFRRESVERNVEDRHRGIEDTLDKGYGGSWVEYEPQIKAALLDIAQRGRNSPWSLLVNERGEIDTDLLIYKVSNGKLGRHTKRVAEERQELDEALGSSMLPTKGTAGRTIQAGKQPATVDEAWELAKKASFQRRR